MGANPKVAGFVQVYVVHAGGAGDVLDEREGTVGLSGVYLYQKVPGRSDIEQIAGRIDIDAIGVGNAAVYLPVILSVELNVIG